MPEMKDAVTGGTVYVATRLPERRELPATYTEFVLGWRDRLMRERRSRAMALWAVLGLSLALWGAIWLPLWWLFT